MKVGLIDIDWLGHASFRIRGSKTVYIDPFKLRTSEKADIILITHEHFDHCSPEDIKKIRADKTVVVCPRDCAEKIGGDVKTMQPGDSAEIIGIGIEAVHAYNIGKSFHPKEKMWNGYIIEIDKQRIYHAGDTDVIPEMDGIKADIALLPVGGTYTMNYGEAANAVDKINPTYVVPMHYGTIVGAKEDAEKLKSICG
ncbi:MAG: MBL fold metallo-hydrolase, partial [Candidatus Woesearchaeota archaeon]